VSCSWTATVPSRSDTDGGFFQLTLKLGDVFLGWVRDASSG